MSFFGDLFGNGAAEDAANAKITGLNAGYSQASDLFGQGRDAATTNYNNGVGTFQNLMGLGANGENAYADATGANGAAGNARAVSNFQTSPGYQFAFDQGLQGVDRGAASRGMLGSGNTLQAEQTFGNNLANQNYQQYVTNLQPFVQQQTSAQDVAAYGAGGLQGKLGDSLNSSLGNQGNLAFQTQAGVGNANAAADTARLGGEQNLFNFGMSGLKLGAGLAGFL